MKKIIFILIGLGVISITLSMFISNQTFVLYADQEQAIYDEVLNNETPTVYYYYQETCFYCNTIKDQVSDFAEIINETDGIDFKLVDMVDSNNTDAWFDWDAHNEKYGEGTDPKENPDYIYLPEEMETVYDIKITGTPSAVYVKDGKVIKYGTGQESFDVFEYVNDEFDLGYTFNKEKYGIE